MLNARQKKFAEFYVGECAGHIKNSAVKAGYSESYAQANACELLEKPEVKQYIRTLTQKTEAETVARIIDIKRFWTEIMNSGSYRTQDRLKASELLAKSIGMFDREW